MTVLSLRKILFHISGQYHAEVTDTAVCTPDTAIYTPDFAVLSSALSGCPIDSLNHTSYIYKFSQQWYLLFLHYFQCKQSSLHI